MGDGENASLLDGSKLPPSSTNGNEENKCSSFMQCRVYKRRWYILFVFTMTSVMSNFFWNTWGPIQRPCRLVFGWERWTILLLSSLGPVGAILGAFPSTWLMDTKGEFLESTQSKCLLSSIQYVDPGPAPDEQNVIFLR